tara:strand:+ start:1682 stop:2623 length:942 start_codon:yes stop_codon:yes gene_type:complete
MILIKSILFFSICLSILESSEYSAYEFDIFSIPMDARTNSLAGIAALNSMSIDKIYSLNEFHKKNKTLFSYGQSYAGVISYFQASRVILDFNKSKIAVSLLHKQIDDIPNTQDAWLDVGGSINLSDIDYSNITFYSDQQTALIFLYSYKSELGNIGLKIKPFHTSIIRNNSFGVSIDIGFNRILSDEITLGLSTKNLLSINRWDTGEKYSLQPTISSLVIFSKNHHHLLSEISILLPKTNDYLADLSYKIGYENNIYKKVSLQLGYSSINSLSLGFSINNKNKDFYYSFTPNLNNIILGHNHQFSILLDLPNN